MTRRGLARFTRPVPGTTSAAPDAAPAGAAIDTRPQAATAVGRDASATAGQTGELDATGAPGDDLDLTPTLARFIGARPRPTPGEACEMCATPVADDHRHAVDTERRSLLCVCRGCALLFERSQTDAPAAAHETAGAGPPHGRYRTVPDRYVQIAPFTLAGPAWAALQIPVGIAFVVANTQLERAVAFYPSPGGATESELPLDAWTDIVAANPGLDDVEPDVEAVLLRTDVAEPTCHVVPVDRCYELVGTLRLHWRGFDGGSEVREHIAEFFDDVDRRARPQRSQVRT